MEETQERESDELVSIQDEQSILTLERRVNNQIF